MTTPGRPAPAPNVSAEIDAIQIGDPVEVAFHDTGQGAALPSFRPAGR